MSSFDTSEKVKKQQRSPSIAMQSLPRAPKQVTVVAVGADARPQPLGQAEPSPDAVHFVQVGRSLVIAGTIDDLRGFVADMGMTVADMEREMLMELVEEGNQRARRLQRRLA